MRFMHEWKHGGSQRFWARVYVRSEQLQSVLAIAFPIILVCSIIGYITLAHALHIWYTASYWLLLAVVWSIAPTVFIIYLFVLRLRERQHKEDFYDLDEDLRGDYDTGKMVEDEYDEVDERVLVRGSGINSNEGDEEESEEDGEYERPTRRVSKKQKESKRFTLDFIAEGYVEHAFVPTCWNGLGIAGCVFGILASILASVSSFIVGDVEGGSAAIVTLFAVCSCMYFIIHRSMGEKQSDDIEMSPQEMQRARTLNSIVVVWKLVGTLLGIIVVGLTILASLQAFVYAFNEHHYPPPGRMIDIGGSRRMHLDCEGTGGPTVVYLHGWGGQGYDWAWIKPGVGQYTKSCSLDRAGYGWSDPPSCLLCPRDAKSKAQDLDSLFKASGIDQESIILVIDSEAVWEARVFVNTYPQYKICWIVCVDCMDQSNLKKIGSTKKYPTLVFWDRWRNLLPSGIPGVLAAANKLPKFQIINPLPNDIHPSYVQNQLKPKYPQSVVRDYIYLPQAAQQALDAGDFGSIKMTAIVAGKSYNTTNVTNLSTNSSLLYLQKAPRDMAYHKVFADAVTGQIYKAVITARFYNCASSSATLPPPPPSDSNSPPTDPNPPSDSDSTISDSSSDSYEPN